MQTRFSAISDLIGERKFKQPEVEAITELLIWTMYADDEIRLEENDAIDEFLKTVKWDSPLQPEYYFGSAVAKVRNAMDESSKADALLADIRDRLADRETMVEAVQACYALAQADGEVGPRETEFLARISREFQVELPDQAQE